MNLYKGTLHGFSVRGNYSDPIIKEAQEKAYQDTVEFLQSELNHCEQ